MIKKYDIINIDYFSKINKQKMCNLQLIVRKIETVGNSATVIGKPE